MCGRFVRVPGIDEVVSAFHVEVNHLDHELRPSYNVAPSHRVPIVGQGEPRDLNLAVWGFTAPWKGAGALVINARVETVFEKLSFRSHTAEGRCAIPMSGYYEWLTNDRTKSQLGIGKGKVPFFIRAVGASPLRHQSMLVAAGLVRTDDAESRCVMLTTAANESVRQIHDRMPVLLDSEGLEEWLSGRAVPAMEVVLGGSMNSLESTRASLRVNSVANDDPSVLEPDPPTTLF